MSPLKSCKLVGHSSLNPRNEFKRQLRSFRTNSKSKRTCQHSTISQAAQKLQISQPALSGSIKRLEERQGFALFYRSKKGIQLTPNGKSFQSKADAVLRALGRLDEDVGRGAQIFADRVISIGCHAVVAQYCLPKALEHLQSLAPDYKINLTHDLSRNILVQIQLGRIDVGVLINPVRLQDLVVRPIADDRIGIWHAPKSKNFDTIICERDLFQTQSILKKWRQKPARLLQTSSIELMCHLTERDLGWAIIPERAVKLSGVDLVLEEKLPMFRDEICLVMRPEFGKTAAEKMVVDSLRRGLIG